MRSLRNAVNETINMASVAVIAVLAITFIASAAPLYLVRYKPLLWWAFVAPLPIAAVVDTRLRRSIKCPQCSGDLRPLVRLGQFGRGYGLSMRIAPEVLECPHCAVNFDTTRAPDRAYGQRWTILKATRLFASIVLLPLLASVAIILCFGLPFIVVRNVGTTPLALVYARGAGFDAPLGTVAPGETAQVVVRPNGDSGLSLAWTVDGSDFQQDELGSLQRFGGHCVVLVINGKQLSIETQRTVCPSLLRLTRK